MKKLAITALAALMATLGAVSTASANSRDGDEYWRQNDRDGGRHADRRGDRDRDDWRRRDRDRDHSGWRHHHWRRDHWRGPRVVIRPYYRDDYCFVKKVRRYDDWGNVYIKRIRICR